MTRNADIDRHGLNYVMDFDHVVQVHADGRVTDDITDVYAPEFVGDSATGTAELEDDGWSIMSDGYTGQQGGGNVMHDSESIGGRLERDILATPGFYVAVLCSWQDDCTCDAATGAGECECGADDSGAIEGWAVVYRETL